MHLGPGRPTWGLVDSSNIFARQEVAHKRLMCQRQACEAQTPEPLRRHRSLTAHSLLPLAEKQRRVLRNLRRLEGLGLVSARNGYQELVDELAKVMSCTWVGVCVYTCVLVCTSLSQPIMLIPRGRPFPGGAHSDLLSARRGLKVFFFFLKEKS